ncbi:hypothetical protein GYA25_02035 [Candidatus Woesearchaeota archaeon]|nr:hypothetical protein [Candidatus Woesearchaeota archaeon]
MQFKELTNKVMNGDYLSFQEISSFISDSRQSLINGLEFVTMLTAMETRNRIKGINLEECASLIKALKLDNTINLENLLCNSGTGGDKIKTINISTPSSIVIASCGVKVLKNGSRRISGCSGSKEFLDYLGIDTNRKLDLVKEDVKNVGIGYFDFSNLIPIKERSGLRSPLNYIGPLCNPSKVTYKILGTTDLKYVKSIKPLLNTLFDNYIVIYNELIDELSLSDNSYIFEKKGEILKEYVFNPREEKLPFVDYKSIAHPGEIGKGVEIVLESISGKENPPQEIISLNAGVGIYLANKVKSIKEGYYLAKNLICSKKVISKLNEWREFQKKNYD